MVNHLARARTRRDRVETPLRSLRDEVDGHAQPSAPAAHRGEPHRDDAPAPVERGTAAVPPPDRSAKRHDDPQARAPAVSVHPEYSPGWSCRARHGDERAVLRIAKKRDWARSLNRGGRPEWRDAQRRHPKERDVVQGVHVYRPGAQVLTVRHQNAGISLAGNNVRVRGHE
jgi:hypothetical protein